MIQREPVEDRDRFFLAMLRDLAQAKQAAILALDDHAIAPILEERRYKFRYSPQNEQDTKDANSLKTNSGPARIRTWDQRIMSPLL